MGKKNKKTSREDFDRGIMSKFYGPGKEAQDMLKRYGVEGYRHGRTDRGSEGYRGVAEVRKDLANAMMNDYDTRRTMEAAAMAGNKKAKKFAKNGFDAGNLQDAYGVMRKLKKKYVGGGGMDGAENRAGLTYEAVKADREAQTAAYDETYAKTTDLNKMKEELLAQAQSKVNDGKPIEPSDRFAAVQDRLEGAASNKPPSMFDKDNAKPAKADDQADAARSFLDDYKLDVAKGANLKHDIETGVSNAARTVRDTYGR